MSRLKKVNDGTTFILTVIDVFSQTSLVRSAKEQASKPRWWPPLQLLSNGAPDTLQTDKGTEFLNRSLQKLLKEHGVHHFATHNEETKASIVERFNRTLKTRCGVISRNPVGSIRRCPAGIYAIVQRHLSPQYRYGSVRSDTVPIRKPWWQRLYGHESVGTPKFRVGNRVRISKSETTLRKGVHGELDRRTVYDC